MMDDNNSSDSVDLMQIDDSDNRDNFKKKGQSNEKRELAEKIKMENENYLKSKEKTKIDRLKFILQQTEIFAHFLVGKTTNTKSSNKGSDTQVHRKRANNNKRENISLLKSIKERDLDDDGDMDNEAPQITRLYYQPSILTGGKLTEYQLDGLNWLINLYENSLNGILADEMGLGKTIQSISFMSYLKQYKKKDGYFLVVVPKTTMPNWNREFKKWCPSMNVVLLNPVKEEREETIRKYISKHKFEVVLTSYEGVNLCLPVLRKIKWESLIIDEAHRIKNENTLLSKNVRLLDSNFRLLVTGTPLQNNLHELWALLNFLLPEVFSSSEDFDEWFALSSNPEENQNAQEEKNAEIVQQLHKILKPFLLRRTKAEVEKTLPPKKEIYIKIGLTEVQKNVYKKLLTSSAIAESKTIYRNIIMQLRKACNHPYLFEGVEDQNLPELGEHLINNSSKMRILDKLLAKLKVQGSQVLIFSQMTKTLDIIEDYCVYRGYTYCRIDGNTSLEDRETFIQEFTAKNSKHFLFLLSTRAGGLGLNLMTADTVILYDSDWNPQVDLQAMDRVHRIGQTKPVLVYRLICENTIEERIVERQAMRLKLDSLVIQQGRVSKSNDAITKEEMKEMIQYGADQIFKPGDDFKDEDIDLLLERGERQTQAFMNKAEMQAKNKSNLLIDMNFNSTNLYRFEDEDYLKKRKEDADKILSAYYDEIDNEKLGRRDKLKLPNYNIDQNFDQLLNNQKNLIKKKLKQAKIPVHHLYDNKDRLLELKTIQISYFADNNKKLPEKFDEDMGISEGLSEDDQIDLTNIISSGFPLWEKREYDIFISSLDKYGKTAIDKISDDIETKTPNEVDRYLKVFLVRGLELPDGSRVIKNLEKREKVEKQKENSNKIISKKIGNEYNYENIRIIYPPSSNRNNEYSSDEDQYLVYLTFQYGYGNWDDIVKEIRICEEFMFNYFLKSRDKSEIQKRVDYLVKLIEKEYEPQVPKAEDTKKKKAADQMMDIDDGNKSRKVK